MKKYLLLATILFQFANTFGQCNTSTGTECNLEITYFKCSNGYKAPAGFEWMKPTKIYLPFGNLIDKRGNYTSIITFNPYATASGENLESINKKSLAKGRGVFRGNYSNSPFDFKTNTLCLDCGLGYWATVQLLDNFIAEDEQSFPNQGLGYTCGQPTAERALEVAWQEARKSLNKPAVAFTYTIGTNAKPIDETDFSTLYNSSGESLTKMFLISQQGFGYPQTPPDNANDFVALVKKREKFRYNNDPKRDIAFGYYFNESEYDKNYAGNTDYPVFTEPINGAKSTGNNATTENSAQKRAGDENISPSLEVVDKNVEQFIIQANELSKSKLTAQQLMQKANEFENQKDYINYAKYEEAAAIKGNVEAMISTGHHYRGAFIADGKSIVPLDYGKAKYWFQKAHNKGNTGGTNGLAFIYENGWGEEIDYEKAAYYYTISANKGNDIAMDYLGRLYEKGGYGLDKDIQKAKEWYDKACKAGNDDGCYDLKALK